MAPELGRLPLEGTQRDLEIEGVAEVFDSETGLRVNTVDHGIRVRLKD